MEGPVDISYSFLRCDSGVNVCAVMTFRRLGRPHCTRADHRCAGGGRIDGRRHPAVLPERVVGQWGRSHLQFSAGYTIFVSSSHTFPR